jgi:hypothetical protein
MIHSLKPKNWDALEPPPKAKLKAAETHNEGSNSESQDQQMAAKQLSDLVEGLKDTVMGHERASANLK